MIIIPLDHFTDQSQKYILLKNNLPFDLYANCLLVNGANRSLICDLEENRYFFIPNSLYSILVKFKKSTISNLKSNFPDSHDVIDEYFEFLVENNLIHFSKNLEFFPKISTHWESANPITHAILDIQHQTYNYLNVTEELDGVFCRHIQYRIYTKKAKTSVVEEILQFVESKKLSFLSLDFLLPYSVNNEKASKSLLSNFARIHSIVLYGAPNNTISDPNWRDMGFLITTTESVIDERNCGLIHPSNFIVNTKSFTESQKFNSCLNGKISVDKFGNIKNCPSMAKSYGHINDKKLSEIINNGKFQKLWSVNKDQISICNSCEFRHICTDCRAYLNDPDDLFSKPLKCGYDPITSTWSEWADNSIKGLAIKNYNLEEIIEFDG